MMINLPKSLNRKYVSRAAFARMQAEKQRLMKDIRLMVKGGDEGLEVWKKWKKHYKFWEDIQEGLIEIAKKEMPAILEKYKKSK